MDGTDRLGLVVAVADLRSSVDRLELASALRPEASDQLAVRAYRAVAVAYSGGEVGRLRAEAGHEHRRRLIRSRVDARVAHLVVLARVVHDLARPEATHQLDRLFEHVET